MTLRAALLILLVTGTSLAHAARTLNCSIADKSLTLVLEGTIGDGAGESLVSVGGELSPTVAVLSPAFGPFVLERAHITQFWLKDATLNLRLYREIQSPSHEMLEVIIETRREKRDRTAYAGRYRGRASHLGAAQGPVAAEAAIKGRVDCQVR